MLHPGSEVATGQRPGTGILDSLACIRAVLRVVSSDRTRGHGQAERRGVRVNVLVIGLGSASDGQPDGRPGTCRAPPRTSSDPRRHVGLRTTGAATRPGVCWARYRVRCGGPSRLAMWKQAFPCLGRARSFKHVAIMSLAMGMGTNSAVSGSRDRWQADAPPRERARQRAEPSSDLFSGSPNRPAARCCAKLPPGLRRKPGPATSMRSCVSTNAVNCRLTAG